MKEALKIAHEYALKKGYPSDVTFLKKWHLSYIFKLKQPVDDDFGEPLVVVVESDRKASIRPLTDVL